MSRNLPIIVLVIVIALSAISVYTQQNNKVSLARLADQLKSMQVQVNRGYSEQELPKLTEEQKRDLDSARRKVLEARRELIQTELKVGLITQEEAQFFLDHLELMDKYGQDYDPPAWGWSHRDMEPRMMRHHR